MVAGLAVAVAPPLDVAPALQVYVVAPPAVNVAVCPAQIVTGLSVTTGIAYMVTVEVVVDVQPPAAVIVCVIVYVPGVV